MSGKVVRYIGPGPRALATQARADGETRYWEWGDPQPVTPEDEEALLLTPEEPDCG